MSDENKTDGLVVKAGSIQVLTQVGAGRAWVDVPQGAPVPDDLSDEDRERFLKSGAIGRDGDAAYVAAARPVAGEVEPDEIDPKIIPSGSVEQILGWVGDDLARARVARDMELAKGLKARAVLVKALDEVKAAVETEPPAVPEAYDPTVQPAAPAAEVVTAPDDADAEPNSTPAELKSTAAKPKR
jgi:hypothetical protein